MDNFYVKDNDGEKGPFTFEELTDGRLEPNDMVRTDFTSWEKASDILDFAEYFRYEGYYFATETNLASFWIRLLAFIIDHVIVSFLIGFGFVLFADYLPFSINTFNIEEPHTRDLVQRIYLITLFVYNLLLCALPLSSTLGQALCRLVIVDGEGRKINPLKAMIRSAAKIFSFLFCGAGFWSVLFMQHKQGIHDMLAKTYVIRKDEL
ncbi:MULTISPECIES: RDD family protein [unclassified Mucilaginibacter]|uniref:RDD family protein n=1 Tax=unclassified Mucilaginibacter TaxID=2617802 RepID=UPI0031F62983